MFGITLESDQFFQQVLELISRLEETHLLTFVIAMSSMALLLVIRRVNKALPGPLIAVALGIILSYRVRVGRAWASRSSARCLRDCLS